MIQTSATQGGTNITMYSMAKPGKVQPHTARSDW